MKQFDLMKAIGRERPTNYEENKFIHWWYNQWVWNNIVLWCLIGGFIAGVVYCCLILK